MINVDVIIISWAKNDYLHKVTTDGLDSLIKSEDNIIFNTYIVESNHSINYDNYNLNSPHTFKTIHPDTEFGYHKYLNIGRKAGKSDYVALCNSDLTYEKNWASNIINAMNYDKDLLSTTPWCPQSHPIDHNHMNKIYYGYRVRYELGGWCIFQQRKIYDIIGDLDERFRFWYCDDDYGEELKKHKIKHALIGNSIVNHHDKGLGKTGETLDDKLKYEFTQAQQAVFNEKWKK